MSGFEVECTFLLKEKCHNFVGISRIRIRHVLVKIRDDPRHHGISFPGDFRFLTANMASGNDIVRIITDTTNRIGEYQSFPQSFSEIRGTLTFSFIIDKPRSNGYNSAPKSSRSLRTFCSFTRVHPIVTKFSAILSNCWVFNARITYILVRSGPPLQEKPEIVYPLHIL